MAPGHIYQKPSPEILQTLPSVSDSDSAISCHGEIIGKDESKKDLTAAEACGGPVANDKLPGNVYGLVQAN